MYFLSEVVFALEILIGYIDALRDRLSGAVRAAIKEIG
jgi:hypothetical protein